MPHSARGTKVSRVCICGCGRTFEARLSDVERGWGLYFSKSCKARGKKPRTATHEPLSDKEMQDMPKGGARENAGRKKGFQKTDPHDQRTAVRFTRGEMEDITKARTITNERESEFLRDAAMAKAKKVLQAADKEQRKAGAVPSAASAEAA